ncbi:protein quick-to-court isoform X5 [Condylostylus longicornis]|uniref:protein quick-to-court isoform X5 n=1 Tax=Condylostylus longicornis TaxID=2530218 RepID=UPI00244DCFD9|nr:protein quick-to-court isoform X5 [Condylostylus longicornis]
MYTLNLNAPSTSNANNNSNNNASTSMKSRTPITPKTPHTPKTPSRSNCSPSSSTNHNKITPKTPPVTPDSYNTYIDDDLDSVYSYSSGRSTMSCDHPYVARNGTTFSGRKMKYVVHCSAYAGQVGDDYLTPTQRAQRQLRRLKELLTQARQDLEQKDSELLRLTREVVELRLFKASLSSPEDPSNSSDAVTVREAPTDLKTSQDVSPIVDTMMLDDGIKSSPKHVLFHHGGNSGSGNLHHHHHHIHHPSHINNYNIGSGGGNSSSSSSHQTSTNYLDKISNSEMQSSFADSGHFEDMTTSHSTQDQACGSDNNLIETYEEQRAELIRLYEKKIEELIKNQDDATGELKKSHNDRIEALLQKLADINTRYADIVPDYEQAKEKIRELEKQLEDLQQKLLEHEETQKKMYLHMYQKGQEAERIARAEQIMEIAHRQPNRVSIPELLQQLQSTQDELENIRVCNNRERGECALLTAKEAISLWVLGARKTIYRRLIEAQQNKQKVDPEVTLQFLKSAIYYFLTDKENSQGHLNAIESILEFSEQEKEKIHRARTSK